MLLPFDTKNVKMLFKDELFCYYYSLFKFFVDQLAKDYRTHIATFTYNVYHQVIEKFDKS